LISRRRTGTAGGEGGCGVRDEKGSTVAGVELGGTKCVVTLAEGREILDQARVATTAPEEALSAIRAILDRWQFAALGVASFGPVDLDPVSPTYGFITSTTKPGWRDTDILGPLTAGLTVPTGFDTDVNGAALAEMHWGAGQGMADFAYVTVGTGIGVGLVVNGRPTRGFLHGELGHIRPPRLPGDDWSGGCPYHGACVEGLASGTAIRARLGARDVADVPADDPLWDGVAHALAQLCHVIVCAAAPRRIAIGGGVVERQPQLLPRIAPLLVESLAGYMPLPHPETYICSPALGPMAGPLGPIAMAQALVEPALGADEDQPRQL
jgi:fructokinase